MWTVDCADLISHLNNTLLMLTVKYLRRTGYTYMKNCWSLDTATTSFLVRLPSRLGLDGNLVKSG